MKGGFSRKLRTPLKRACFLLAVLISAIPAVMLGSAEGYAPMLTIFVLAAISLLYSAAVSGKLKLSGTFPHEVYVRGETAKLEAEFVNRSFLPTTPITVTVRICDGVGKVREEERPAFMLGPRGKTVLSVHVPLEHMGRYEIGIKSARICDWIGLFSFNAVKHGMREIKVAPRLERIAPFPARSDAGGRARNRFRKDNDREDYNGVREFASGDSLRDISWKLTAHTDRLMSRIYERTHRRYLTVIADFSRPESAESSVRAYECLVESALSVAFWNVRRTEPVRFVCLGRETRVDVDIRDPSAVEKLGMSLADYRFGDTAEKSGICSYPGDAVLFTARLDDKTVGFLENLRAAEPGRRIKLIYAAPENGSAGHSREFAYLESRGIVCRRISLARELVRTPQQENLQ